MRVDLKELRQYYASLTGDELAAIDRAELTEIAQKCYDEELAQWTPLHPAATGSPEPDDEETGSTEDHGRPGVDGTPAWLPEAAEVFSYLILPGSSGAAVAENARQALDAAGIPCQLEVCEIREEKSSPPPATHRWRLLVPGHLNLYVLNVIDRDIYNDGFEDQWRAYLQTLSDRELLSMSPRTSTATCSTGSNGSRGLIGKNSLYAS